MQSVSLHLSDQGLSRRAEFFRNGQEVVNYFTTLLKNYEQDDLNESRIQPIALLLLDINMPIMTGIEAISIIKKKFRQANNALASRGRSE